MSLNAHYLVLFKNVREMRHKISRLATQMYPNKSKILIDAYRNSTSTPYSYLFVDLKPITDEKIKIKISVRSKTD